MEVVAKSDTIDLSPHLDNFEWIDVAITSKGAFIFDCDEGFKPFLDGIWWEDNFDRDVPNLPVGAYRWQNFKIGFWDEDDAMNIKGGSFTLYNLPQVTNDKDTPDDRG